jgi:hypothetical protein
MASSTPTKIAFSTGGAVETRPLSSRTTWLRLLPSLLFSFNDGSKEVEFVIGPFAGEDETPIEQ